jgi:two-component system, chemotaxis family, protein-glutamate methylesterase/glutaminase
MIKVLIVEDSLTAQILLKQIFSVDGNIQVIGTARDGLEALEFMQKNDPPDVVTMDLHMPIMDGLEATRRIMETKPVPILIVSNDWHSQNKSVAFDYLEAGAVAALEKPQRLGDPSYEELCKELLDTIKIMAEVKVIRRFPSNHRRRITRDDGVEHHGARLVVIGASTGGPPVLKTILSGFSEDFRVPILIVQHIAKGFLPGLAEWLDASTHLTVTIGQQGQQVLPGHAYLAPDGFEMGVSRPMRIYLSAPKPGYGPCPSVSYLFRSALITFGHQSIGILLSGMGKDGAEELSLMRRKGAITIAQDGKTCVVDGMPGTAVKMHGVTYVLPPERIAPTVERLVTAGLHHHHPKS